MKISPGLAALLLALSPIPADSVGAATPASAATQVSTSTEVSISSVRGSPGAGPVPAPAWSWPLSPRPAVLRTFDPPARPWLSGHRGVDIEASHDGAQVISPAAGTVSFVGTVVDRPVITIDHGNGLRSSFEPVASSLTAGSAVSAGRRPGAGTGRPLRPGAALPPLGRPPRRRLRQPACVRDGPETVCPAPAP